MWEISIVLICISITVEGNTSHLNTASSNGLLNQLPQHVKVPNVIYHPPQIVHIPVVNFDKPSGVTSHNDEVLLAMEERRRQWHHLLFKKYGIHFVIIATVSTLAALVAVIIHIMRKRRQDNGTIIFTSIV
ncbi:hypothetical protein FQA39_LY15704 [Lamprigera yunnana]|nr:hypothetical protein FQA39_LY15704 [Lamprigera yunnana]